MKMCVATLSTPEIASYAEITARWKEMYCARHGYALVHVGGTLCPERHPAWSKILLLRALATSYDWIWWTDADATIYDMDVRLEGLVLPDEKADVVIGAQLPMRGHGGWASTGSFLVRGRCRWTDEWLRMVWNCEQDINHEWWENRAVLRVYEDNEAAMAPHFRFVDYSVINYGAQSGCENPPCPRKGSLLVHAPASTARARTDFFKALRPLGQGFRIVTRPDFPGVFRMLGYKKGVEVGVYRGDFSAWLNDKWGGRLDLIDMWMHVDGYRDNCNHCADEQEANCRFVRDRFDGSVNVRVVRKSSLDAAKDYEDGSLDFAYVDADHRYGAVKADIEAWWPKVRVGGMLCGHDYLDDPLHRCGEFGVKRAVDEWASARSLAVGSTNEEFPSWWVTKGG